MPLRHLHDHIPQGLAREEPNLRDFHPNACKVRRNNTPAELAEPQANGAGYQATLRFCQGFYPARRGLIALSVEITDEHVERFVAANQVWSEQLALT